MIYCVCWTDKLKWFEDKFDAQDLVLELQSQGINPRVVNIRSTDQERDC